MDYIYYLYKEEYLLIHRRSINGSHPFTYTKGVDGSTPLTHIQEMDGSLHLHIEKSL
jgi:hypothetical protein